MTFKPTAKRQRQWVEDHLNNGVCPRERDRYEDLHNNLPFYHGGRRKGACYDALDWLSDTNIKTLAGAWDACERADWLLWMLCWMEPDVEDAGKALGLLRWITSHMPKDSASRHDGQVLRRKLKSGSKTPVEVLCRVHYYFWLSGPSVAYHRGGLRERDVVQKIKELWGNPWRGR
jgi:hypothetical protein